MQYPVGQEFNPDTMRFEMTSFMDVALHDLMPQLIKLYCDMPSEAACANQQNVFHEKILLIQL